jgi:tetratricopeptide (TPR) repeat protein
MDKDPAKRYGSADQLAADLHRYVRNEAVSVFAGSQLRALKMLLFRYRAASAVLLAVFGGLAFAAVMLGSYTLYAARRARVAESQYADIRQIAHFLFRFDEGSLSSLGQTQRMAVAPTLEALDRLAGRAGSDLALMRELAEAYVRVGDFQTTAYVLDPRGAEASYRKALALAEHVTTQEPLNTPQKAATARINVKLGDLLYNQGQFAEAAGKYGNALDAYEKVASRERAARQGRRNILATLEKVGHARLQAGEFQLASETYSRFMLFARSWLMEEADNLEAQATIAYGMERAAYVLVKSGKAAAGEAGISDAAAAYQKLLLADPTPQLRRAAANCYTILGDTRKDLGRKPQAAESYRQARRILEQLWTEDQQSIQAQRDLAGVEVRLAAVLVESGQAAEAGSLVTRALRLLRPRAESILASPGEMLHFARLLLTAPVVELRDPAAALAIAQRAVESSAVHDPRALQVLASAYAARGENEKAIEAQRKAISALPDRSATPLRKELEAGLVKLVNPNAR